jgi:hypothetical protein
MVIYAKIRLDQIDTGWPKGEELDRAIEDSITTAIEGIDIEGREVSQVSIEREKPQKNGKDSPRYLIGQSLASIAGINLDGVQHLPQLEDKCPIADHYTWREMLIWWGQELMKSETSHDRSLEEALKRRSKRMR